MQLKKETALVVVAWVTNKLHWGSTCPSPAHCHYPEEPSLHGGGDCQMPSQRGGQQQNTSPKLCAGYITSIQQLRLLPVQPGIITYTKTTKQKLQPLSSSRMNLRGVQLTDPWPTNQPKPAPPVGAELVFHRRKDSDGAALRSGRMDESPPERRMILSKIGCLIDR